MTAKKKRQRKRPDKPQKEQREKHQKELYISLHPVRSIIVISAVLLLIFYFQVMIAGNTFQPPDKMNSASIGPFLKDSFSKGNFPLWNPYLFSGMPSFGSLLSAPRVNIIDLAVISILNAIKHIIPLPDFTFIFLNYIFFALVLYILMRTFKVSILPAFLSSLSVIFMPQFVAFTAFSHNTKFLAVVLIPLILLFTIKLLERKNLLYFSALALAIGFQMMRVHIQVSYYTFLLLGIFFIVKAVADWREKKSLGSVIGSGALLGGAVAVGVLLSSVLYMSVLDYQRFSIRGGGATGGLDFGYASSWSFHPLEIITFLVPSFMGFSGQTYWGQMPWTDYPLYFGVLIFLLAGVAFTLRRDRMTWFLGIVALFSLIVSFGRHLPVLYGPMYKFLPFFDKFRIPSMIHILLDLSMVMLAGIGLQGLFDFYAQENKEKAQKRKLLRKYLTIFAGIVALIALFLILGKSLYFNMAGSAKLGANTFLKEQAYNKALLDGLKSLGFVVLAIVLVSQFFKGSVGKNFLGMSFIVLIVIDLWLVDFKIIHPSPKASEEGFFAETPAVQFLKKDTTLFRIFPILDSHGGNWYMYHKLQDILGYSAAKLRIYQEFLEETGYSSDFSVIISNYWRQVKRNNQPYWAPVPTSLIDQKKFQFDHAMMNMLNVKYLLMFGLPLSDPNYRQVLEYQINYNSQQMPAWVFENTTVLPRVFFPDSVQVLTGKERIFQRMKDGTFDPARLAILEEKPQFDILPAESNKAEITNYKNQRINIRADVVSPALMVLSEIYYPSGWKAFVDGKETKIYKTNYILRSIFLDPGEHQIEFRFLPASFKIGEQISIVTLILLLMLLAGYGFTYLRNQKRTDTIQIR
jgi:hypothetical protein